MSTAGCSQHTEEQRQNRRARLHGGHASMLFTGHIDAGRLAVIAVIVPTTLWRGSTTARICHSRRVRLLSYNVNYGNREPRASLDAIADADADVVLLQEITARWQAALADRFA